MAKPKAEEEVKSEGFELEIASIGSLYKGSWEKKYWSSSRGKDRYPYPVGYHAVRAYNGGTCKVEILEGPKGPLFMITSADGHSCSGQTPDIAWEKFQKKHCPRMKTWHGKRLLCKIDGAEFFGFKNSTVQRLLRELVRNVSATSERSFLSSSFCNGASITEHDNQHPDACTYPDFQPYLERSQITKKRSRKFEITNTKLDRNGLKRLRSQELIYNAEASNSLQENQRNHKHESLFPLSALKEQNEFSKLQSALPALVPLNSKIVEEKDGFPLESANFSGHLTEGSVPAQDVSKLEGFENRKSARVANHLAEEENLLDRSENFSFLVATVDKAGDASLPEDSPCLENADLFAPDTLDFVQDTSTDSSPISHDKSSCSLKEDLTTANNVISEGLVADSHPEEEIGTYNSSAGLEKCDSDSVGQEITKAMMAVLLPQAVPLLNKFSRKKKATIRASEPLRCMVNPLEENNETSQFVDASFPGEMLVEKTHEEMEGEMRAEKMDLGSVVPSFEHSKSVVLDSFEDDQCGDHITNQVILSSSIVEADQLSIHKDKTLSNTRKELGVVDTRNGSSVCHAETIKRNNILCHDTVDMVLDKKPQEVQDVCENLDKDSVGIEVHLPEDDLVIAPARTEDKQLQEVQDVCTNLNKDSVGIKIHRGETDLVIAPDHSEDSIDANQRGTNSSMQLSMEDISVKTAVAETGSFAQVPNKVYSRKASKLAPLMKTFNDPPSKSIISRNFGDDCIPKTNHATVILLASEISKMNSSVDKPHKEDLFGAKSGLKGQCHGSPVVSKNSRVFSDSEDICNSFDPSILLMKFEAHSDQELIEQMNTVDFSTSVLPQIHKTSSCDYNTSNSKEVKAGSNLKLQNNVKLNNELDGIVELVGCYFHPMPVLSVLLSKKGNEIYICVSCGLLADKNRMLFIYKVAIQEPSEGCPSSLGNTSVMLPFLKDNFGRAIALEKSCLLFTPDGHHLVLLDSMKTPNCREGRIDCLCSTCTSDCSEENAVKIVEVKPGYVSVVVKLKTVDSVQCMLVCEPNHLIAVGESGRLHLWEMNSTWSAQVEEFVITANDCIYPCIVELKRIPKCAALVVGHNGFGEFGVWDISRRIFLSRFSAPSTSICQVFPISLFNWGINGSVLTDTNVEENMNRIMAATKMWFSEHNRNNSFSPSEGEDIAIWLLVSTIPDFDAKNNDLSSKFQTNPVRLWRLALLVKDVVILGSALDPRASAIGASAGHGIIGTHDGLVYMWELSSGIKLGILHHFKDDSISCIATDDSSSQVFAVAGGGQLLVYLHARKIVANH